MEKRISELLAGINAEGVDMELSNRVSADRIKEITMNKIHTSKSSARPLRKLSRIALIAAALAMVLAIGAGACIAYTHYENPAEMLKSFFAENEYSSGERVVEYETIEVDGEVYEKLKTNMPAWERMPLDEDVAEKYIYPYVYGVGESVSYSGYTLTVEAVLYDANIGGGLLYYTVENPNGVAGYSVWVNGEVNWPTTSAYYIDVSHAGRTYIDTAQTADTKLYLCTHFATIEDWGEFELRIGNGAEGKRGDYESLKIELPVEGLDGVELADGKVKLSTIGISIDKEALGLDTANDIDHLLIRYADGSEYLVEQDDEESYISNEAYALDRGRNGDVTYLFNSLIDLEKVSELVIGDLVFTVE